MRVRARVALPSLEGFSPPPPSASPHSSWVFLSRLVIALVSFDARNDEHKPRSTWVHAAVTPDVVVDPSLAEFVRPEYAELVRSRSQPYFDTVNGSSVNPFARTSSSSALDSPSRGSPSAAAAASPSSPSRRAAASAGAGTVKCTCVVVVTERRSVRLPPSSTLVPL